MQTQFPLKVQKCTGRHGKVFVGNDAFHAHLKDRSSVLDELIRELQKIEPVIDPSILQTKENHRAILGLSTFVGPENFKKKWTQLFVEISILHACFVLK